MESLSFRPGRAFLASNSPQVPWSVVFEDEGVAAYFYACDRSQETQERSIPGSILDAMLIYNVASLQATRTDRLASAQWSRDGLRAALYLDGTAQALFDFGQRCGYCRMNFPNFAPAPGETWHKESHAWADATLQRFESELYR